MSCKHFWHHFAYSEITPESVYWGKRRLPSSQWRTFVLSSVYDVFLAQVARGRFCEHSKAAIGSSREPCTVWGTCQKRSIGWSVSRTLWFTFILCMVYIFVFTYITNWFSESHAHSTLISMPLMRSALPYVWLASTTANLQHLLTIWPPLPWSHFQTDLLKATPMLAASKSASTMNFAIHLGILDSKTTVAG